MGPVADGLLNRASDTTRLIDRLEKAGLAERLPNPADRRSVLVRVTPAGQRVFAAVTPKLQDFHRHQWSNLTSDEVDTLHGLLAKALWGSPPPLNRRPTPTERDDHATTDRARLPRPRGARPDGARPRSSARSSVSSPATGRRPAR